MHSHVLKCVSQIFSSAPKKYRYEHDATLSEKLGTVVDDSGHSEDDISLPDDTDYLDI